MIARFSDPFNEKWANDWINDAFWHVLNFVMLAVICYLWAPSQSATRYDLHSSTLSRCDVDLISMLSLSRYAYQEGEEMDEDEVALTSTEGTAAVTEEKKKTVNTDVFSLEDEAEEGKLE